MQLIEKVAGGKAGAVKRIKRMADAAYKRSLQKADYMKRGLPLKKKVPLGT